MTIGIYGLFDYQTQECLYVGLSTNIEYRYKQHLKLLRGKRHRRKDFIQWWVENDENPDNLELRILETCHEDDLNSKEIFWFNQMKPKFYGKEPSENEKWMHSEETKAKIRKTHEKTSKKQAFILNKICKNCKLSFIITDKKKSKQKSCSRKCWKELVSLHNRNKQQRKRMGSDSIYNTKLRVLEDMYYNKKLSTAEIAEKFQISQPAAYNALKTRGIKLRKRSEITERAINKSNADIRSKMIYRTCEIDGCGNRFTTSPSKNQKFCSKKCAGIFRSQLVTSRIHENKPLTE